MLLPHQKLDEHVSILDCSHMGKAVEKTQSTFEIFRDELRKVEAFLIVYRSGVSTATRARLLMDLDRAMGELIGEPSRFDEKALKRADRAKSLATSEIEKGYPYLHGMIVIRVWGVIESLANRVFTEAAAAESSVAPLVDDIRIRLMGRTDLEEGDREDLLVREVSRELNLSHVSGVRKFERLLELVGLVGMVHRTVDRKLYELSKCRNVVVHRGGIVDASFKKACPWRPEKIGEELRVSEASIRDYMRSAYWYLVELKCRSLNASEIAEDDANLRKFQRETIQLIEADSTE